jgi:3',5'-cyclic AMP phosphodiesterase CpdA
MILDRPRRQPFSPMRTFTIAHLSDLHVTRPRLRGRRLLSPKRMIAWLAWHGRKRSRHESEVLDFAVRDLHELNPDMIVVTGDLTQLGLPAEYLEAREWLRKLEDFDLAIVPGNHDVMLAESRSETLDLWMKWLCDPPHASDSGSPDPTPTCLFPTLRLRGEVALIGLSTAHPSPPLFATGRIGPAQLARLRALLQRAGDQKLFRVIFLHHPPSPGTVSWRKRLLDAGPLREVIESEGVELLLHGHSHRPTRSFLSVKNSSVPVLGAPSITQVSRGFPGYLVHRIIRCDEKWQVGSSLRVCTPGGARFEEWPGAAFPPGTPAGPVAEHSERQ